MKPTKVFNVHRIIIGDMSVGFTTLDNVVDYAAKAIIFMKGWKLAKVIKHCKKEGWEFQYA